MGQTATELRPHLWFSGRVKPIKALVALIRLMRDPQDTRQVFLLTNALRGRSARQAFARFAAAPVGRQVLAERRRLIDALTDQDSLAAMPEGSLGRAYLAFMAEEQLTAQGLVDLAEQSRSVPVSAAESVKIYAGRMRDMHDLYHVLAGYGRDELGEICVLAFSYPQQNIRSFKVISMLGAVNIPRKLRRAGINPIGVRAAVREAARNGRAAAWLPGEDLEAMLPEDLTGLRQRLDVPAPKIYREVIARLRQETGIQAGPLQRSAKPG